MEQRRLICRYKTQLTEKMANKARFICIIIIMLHDVAAKCAIKTKIDKTSYSHNMEPDTKITSITKRSIDVKNDVEVSNTTNNDVKDDVNTSDSNVNHRKCELLNMTADIPTYESRQLHSTYLNNMFTGVTMNLIHDDVSIDNLEADGVSLFDLVKSNCGSAKICPNVRGNWTDTNTITIGFLSAYGWSQTVLGALPLAVAAINREPTLLPGLKLRFVTADIGRPRPSLPLDKDSLSLRVMTQMRDLGVVAFFGPDGTCHTEAKLAAAWNLPLISHLRTANHRLNKKAAL